MQTWGNLTEDASVVLKEKKKIKVLKKELAS